MINVTFKLVDDPKMLLSVMLRLESALKNIMESVLIYERMYKRIPPYQESFEGMYDTFRARCTRRYDFKDDHVSLIREVYEILKQHKASPVEFRRKDKFVICTDDYRMKVISVDNIKNYINKAKLFYDDAKRLVVK